MTVYWKLALMRKEEKSIQDLIDVSQEKKQYG
jgi:predicted CopG family antitoxin